MSRLEHAISIAASAHASSLADDNEPYILDSPRIMLSLATNEERIVGVLHDVVEKTGWLLDNLRTEGFNKTILDAIDSVTRRDGEEYFDCVERTKANKLGTRMKIADLNDNIHKVKSHEMSGNTEEKLKKYERALSILN